MNDSGALTGVTLQKPATNTTLSRDHRAAQVAVAKSRTESPFVRILLTTIALAFVGLVLIVPLGVVFYQAFRSGVGVYLAAFKDDEALAAIKLTLLVAAITVPLNTLFGLAASWPSIRPPAAADALIV